MPCPAALADTLPALCPAALADATAAPALAYIVAVAALALAARYAARFL